MERKDFSNSIHQCQSSDGNSKCSYGTTSWSVSAHKTYFGKSVSGFGKDGCPNPDCLKEMKAILRRLDLNRPHLDQLKKALRASFFQPEKIRLGIQIKNIKKIIADNIKRLKKLPCYIKGIREGTLPNDEEGTLPNEPNEEGTLPNGKVG